MAGSDRPIAISKNDDGKLRFSLSPMAMLAMLGTLFTLFSGWGVILQGMATTEDIKVHDEDKDAHIAALSVVLEDEHGHPKPPAVPVAGVVVANARAVAAMPAQMKAVKKSVSDTQSAVKKMGIAADKREAREFARDAISRLPENTPRYRLSNTYEEVKNTAFLNLQNDRPIQNGLERHAF